MTTIMLGNVYIDLKFSLSLHSGFIMHDPSVPLTHHLPLLLLLHGWIPLSLPHPVPGLAGWPDAAQPLPNDGGVLLKGENKKMIGRESEKEKRAKAKGRER